jgi:hypothetical protein
MEFFLSLLSSKSLLRFLYSQEWLSKGSEIVHAVLSHTKIRIEAIGGRATLSGVQKSEQKQPYPNLVFKNVHIGLNIEPKIYGWRQDKTKTNKTLAWTTAKLVLLLFQNY